MTYAQNLWLYLLLVIGIIVVPGMDMFFVIANSLTGGWRLGLAATLGIMLGGIVHTIFGAIAFGVISGLPAALYAAILLAGAAYMLWIGVTLLRSSITVGDVGAASLRSRAGTFWQGTVTCLLNPKAYLFTLAVYPQFMRPHYGPVWRQALAMGALTIATQFAIYGGLGLAASTSRALLTGNPAATTWTGRAVGALFIAAAMVTAFQGIKFSHLS
jgi:threonine/homoserine/homoserine lactone efflux protein